MEEDLSLSSDEYEWLLTIFYIFYILAEPLTLMYKVVSPKAWVPFIVLGWGAVATAQAATQSFAGMMVCRALLAIFEAGYGPGVIYLLSFFYLRREIGLRIGIFFSAAPLATCFAGALAYGITSGHSRLANWRLLFLVEGIPVVLMAVVTYFAMPSSPHDAWFLNEEEKTAALARGVRQTGKEARVGKINWRETISTLLDFKAWLTAVMYFSCNVSYSSLPVFLPTILKDLGESRTTSYAQRALLICNRVFRTGRTRLIRAALFCRISRHNLFHLYCRSNSAARIDRDYLGLDCLRWLHNAGSGKHNSCEICGSLSCRFWPFPDDCQHLTLGTEQPRQRRAARRWDCTTEPRWPMRPVAWHSLIPKARGA